MMVMATPMSTTPQYAHPDDKMVAKYSANHAVAQKETLKGNTSGNCTKHKIRKKIINTKNLHRCIGCHSAALSPGVVITVANAMTDSNSTNHSEIWRMGKEASEIQTEMNAIHRTILGVETSTCMSVVRHELGVKLNCFVLILQVSSFEITFCRPLRVARHTVCVGPFLGSEKRTMHIKNGVKWHMETSAVAIDWTEALGKGVRSSSAE